LKQPQQHHNSTALTDTQQNQYQHPAAQRLWQQLTAGLSNRFSSTAASADTNNSPASTSWAHHSTENPAQYQQLSTVLYQQQ
jgi:hypothetical protein